MRSLKTGGAGGLPTHYKQGLLYSYVSSTTISVSKGVARDSADAASITLSSATTVDITAVGAAGLDSFTSAATATTTGNATLTASASILSELRTRTPTFTSFSTSTTTMTGVGTKFLTSVAANDLVGNSVKGYSRVASIETDTSLTLVAALPGGDAGGGSVGLVVVENPSVWPGATAGDKQQINTLSSAGTVVVAPASFTNGGAGQTLKIGVQPATTAMWMYVWVRSGGSGQTVTFSTQRSTPYSVTGYTTSLRRTGAIKINASGVISYSYQREVSSTATDTVYEEQRAVGPTVLYSGNAQVWTAVALNPGAPPSSRYAYICLYGHGATTSGFINVRERGQGDSAVSRNVSSNNNNSDNRYVPVWCTCDGAQYIDFNNETNVASSVVICLAAFRETTISGQFAN